MAGRVDYFYRQKVTESELDQGFALLEIADFNMMKDLDLIGIMDGGVVTQKAGTPDISVDVTAAKIHDKEGQRISWGSTQNVDVSIDENSQSTDVSGGGNEKIVSLFAKFERVLSDPRIDGYSQTVYFSRAEGYEFIVRQGAESSPPATPPSLDTEYILLADIRRSYGQTQILNTDITPPGGGYTGITNRREDTFVITTPLVTLRAGTPEGIADEIANEIADSENIQFTATETWADGASISSDNVSDAINEIVEDLASQASGIGSSGASKVGAGTYTGTSYTLATGTVRTQLEGVVDNLAGLAADNALTGDNTFSGSNTFQDNIVLAQATQQYINAKGTPSTKWEFASSTGYVLFVEETTGDEYLKLGAGAITFDGAKATFVGSDGTYSAQFTGDSVLVGAGHDLVFDSDTDIQFLPRGTTADPGILIQKDPGTGQRKGHGLNVYGGQGRDVSSGEVSDGGDIHLVMGPRGIGGTATAALIGQYKRIYSDTNGDGNIVEYFSGKKTYGAGTTSTIIIPIEDGVSHLVEIIMHARETSTPYDRKVSLGRGFLKCVGTTVTLVDFTLDYNEYQGAAVDAAIDLTVGSGVYTVGVTSGGGVEGVTWAKVHAFDFGTGA